MSPQCQRSRRSSLSKKRPDRPASISARRSKWRQPFPSHGSSSSPPGQLPPMPWAASLLSLRTSRSGLKEPTQRWSFSVGVPVFEASQLWQCERMGWRYRPVFVQSLKFWDSLGKLSCFSCRCGKWLFWPTGILFHDLKGLLSLAFCYRVHMPLHSLGYNAQVGYQH